MLNPEKNARNGEKHAERQSRWSAQEWPPYNFVELWVDQIVFVRSHSLYTFLPKRLFCGDRQVIPIGSAAGQEFRDDFARGHVDRRAACHRPRLGGQEVSDIPRPHRVTTHNAIKRPPAISCATSTWFRDEWRERTCNRRAMPSPSPDRRLERYSRRRLVQTSLGYRLQSLSEAGSGSPTSCRGREPSVHRHFSSVCRPALHRALHMQA